MIYIYLEYLLHIKIDYSWVIRMVEDRGKKLMVIGTIRDLKVCGNGRCQKMQEDTVNL